MPKTKTNSRPALTLELTRIFAAPRRLVFAAWTQPKHIRQWSCPHGFTLPVCEGDLRPGGTWRSCMCKSDGEMLWLGGVYREIIPNELLVFTHAWVEDDGKPGHETIVTIRFADHGAGTKMFFHQSGFASPESRDGHRGGWTECFNKLNSHLKNLKKKN